MSTAQKVPFRDLLLGNIPLLLDGATGTELYNRGMFINRCFEEANLSSPNLVSDLHKDYVRAGAQAITTNSWGANYFKLLGHNLQKQIRLINVASAKLAREAAGTEVYVIGSVGPLGMQIEPWGATSFQEARAAFREQMEGLIEGGVEALSLETFSDITEIREAIFAAKELDPKLPVLAQVMINTEGRLAMGTPLEWAIQKLDEWGADAVGLNCSVGPQPMLSAVEKIRRATKKPIILQPNAGLPKQVEGRTIYMCTPEYMAEFTKNFLEAGVLFVGGCCGTTPEHIRAMAQTLRHQRAMRGAETQSPQQVTVELAPLDMAKETHRVAFKEKSSWSRKIAAGEMVYSVELLPPPSVVPTQILERSAELKRAGVDAVNIPDGPRASARMSAILTAVLIEQKIGIETVLHYTCRDRNLLGMQSDMLGAHAIGLRNLLLITGDPPKMGSYPSATGVFDVDAIGLTNMVHRLNGGLDLGARPIGQPTAISIGVGVNPVHRDFEYEMRRFRYKVDAGAEWAITQPVFDIKALYRFLEFLEKSHIKIPIIAGIWPLISHKNAVFMNNEVPGVVIPETVMRRMAQAVDPEESRRTGVAIASEMVKELGSDIAGVQVSAPFGRVDLALAVIGKGL